MFGRAAATGTLAFVVGLAACGGSDDTPDVTSTTASSTTSTTADLGGPAVAKLRAYLEQNFSGTTWYSLVTGIELFGSCSAGAACDVNVMTRIHPEANGSQDLAERICTGVSSGVFTDDQAVLTGVRVVAANGERLVWRESFFDSCD